MTERSAIEILCAQLEFEVVEAKRDVVRELGDLSQSGAFEYTRAGDALETLIDRCVKRWWLTRMQQKPEKPMDEAELRQRMDQRAQTFAACTHTIVAKSGPIDAAALQMSILGMSAELNAVWMVMLQSALVNQSSRQDYMDSATAELYARISAYAQKIVVASGNGTGLKAS